MEFDRLRHEFDIQYAALKRRWQRTDSSTQKLLIMNVSVFGLSKIPGCRQAFYRHFVAGWGNTIKERRFHTVATSVFAHTGFFHLAFNSYAAYNLVPFVKRGCDPKNKWLSVDDQVLAFIITTGMAANASGIIISKLIPKLSSISFMGMSGALYASFAVLSKTHPNSQWQIMFFPEPVSSESLFSGIVLFDVIGLSYVLIGGASSLAHHVHLSGALAGYIAGTYYFEPNMAKRNKWSLW